MSTLKIDTDTIELTNRFNDTGFEPKFTSLQSDPPLMLIKLAPTMHLQLNFSFRPYNFTAKDRGHFDNNCFYVSIQDPNREESGDAHYLYPDLSLKSSAVENGDNAWYETLNEAYVVIKRFCVKVAANGYVDIPTKVKVSK